MNSSSLENPSLVQGEIVFDESGSSFSGATVHVYLEDIGRVDAPARIVTEQILPDISHTTGIASRLPFALEAADLDERNHYSVRVHVDVDGDGQISRGDFLTMVSHPVLTFGYPNSVIVKVNELR